LAGWARAATKSPSSAANSPLIRAASDKIGLDPGVRAARIEIIQPPLRQRLGVQIGFDGGVHGVRL
jgi:hypothetical protein